VRLRLNRGVPWDCAEELFSARCDEAPGDGFYWWRRNGPSGSPEVPALVAAAISNTQTHGDDDEDQQLFVLHTPQGSLTKLPGETSRITYGDLRGNERFRKAGHKKRGDIGRAWRVHYDKACQATEGHAESCYKDVHVLGGSILNVWGAVGAAVGSTQSASSSSKRERLPLLRARIGSTNESVVGVRVDASSLPEVRYALNALLESRTDAAAASSSSSSAATPKGEAVAVKDAPSWDVVLAAVKKHLDALPDQCDPNWESWSDLHTFLVAKGLADKRAESVVAVQHWFGELLRCRVLDRHPDSNALRIRPVVNHTGWYMPEPKPKPLPRRGRGGRGSK